MIAAAAVLALGTSTALAGTLTYDGAALVFTGGDNLNHELQFRYDSATARDIVIDSHTITSAPGDCQYEGTDTSVSCPGHVDVRIELGGGWDYVDFHGTSSAAGDCFDSYVINLGEGSNETVMDTTCGNAGVGTINAGSGDDRLRGGSASTRMTINAGGGDDNVDGGEGADAIYGGEGADGVFGGEGDDQVYGEGGDDQLRGDAGNDIEDGGPGDDDIGFRGVNVIGEPDPGSDQVRGGSGVDFLRLDGHTEAMAISLDGQANDGTPGEGDNIGSDIETIRGTPGNDVFRGSPGADGFDGRSGNDEIHGAEGNDLLTGGGGDDRLFGDAGNDKVEGTNGTDTVDGGPGSDQLNGDSAGCSIFCSPDIDTMLARDGERDTVNCGGPGTAQVDQLDAVGGCASVDRQSVGGKAGGGGAGALAKASFGGSKRSVKVSRTGRFRYSFRAGPGLSGKAVFRSAKKVQTSRGARVTLATKPFKAPGSGRVTLKMRLSPRKLAILRRNRRIKTRVTVTLKNAAGSSSVASTTVVLKR